MFKIGSTYGAEELAAGTGRGSRSAALTRERGKVVSSAGSPIQPQGLGAGKLFEAVRDAVVVADPRTGRIVLWNPAATKIFEYSHPEALELSVDALVPERLRARHRAGIERYRKTGQGSYVDSESLLELPALRKDGEEISVEMSLSTIRPHEETPLRGALVLAIIRDVTKRERAKREIRELNEDLENRVAERTAELSAERTRLEEAKGELGRSREQFEAILGAIADGVMARDASGRVVYANKPAAGILGYPSARALLGTPAEEVFGGLKIAGESGGELPERELPVHKALRGERVAEALVRLREKATGEERWTFVKAQPVFDERGGVRLAVSVLRDVTNLKRAQEQLETRSRQRAAVAELGRLALGGVDPAALMEETVKCTAEGLQTEYCKLLELLPEGDALLLRAGVGWEEGLVGRARVEAGARSQGGYALLSRQPVVSEDLRTERRFEASSLLKEHGVVGSASVVIEGRGRPFGVLGAHTTSRRHFTQDDVNFLKMVANVLGAAIERAEAEEEVRDLNSRLEEEVRRRTAQLEAANEDLEAFARMVSHDLRNRLTSIIGFSEMLLEDYADTVDETGRYRMRSIAASGERMYALTEDLLEFSKAGQGAMHRERVDLGALAQDIAGELEGAQPERTVEFVAEEGLVAVGDARLLRVVLENLIGNAWKFTGKRSSARVEFGALEGTGVTRYFVRDNGAGFDPAHASRLFEPFERSHEARDFRGTGIGLATVKRVIERHGGRVWAEGAAGEGATFYFTLQPAPEEER